ncbi:MAG TPA: hypothetical protein VK859_14990, partial [bacterium]|nr:hypothetical protein [bacterium]
MKILSQLFFIFLAIGSSSGLWAQITSVSNVTLNPTNPPPGSTVTVSWSYAEGSAYNQPTFFIVVGTSPAIQPAGTAGETIVVGDGCAPEAQVNGGCGAIGANVPAGTDTFSETFVVPSNLSPGTWYVDVGMNDYNIYLNPNYSGSAQSDTSFTVPLPPPSFNITKSAETTTAAPDGLILFKIDYSFVNTTSFVVADTVPANTTFVAMSPGGTQAGGNLTWNLYSGVGTTQQNGEVWLLVAVNPGDTNGMVITNSAVGTAAGAASGPVTSTATSTVQIPQLTLTKSESSSSVAANSNLTYNLAWAAMGQSLQVFDSYDYDADLSSTTTGSNVTGFDGTGYTLIPAGGTSGTWNINSDAQGNQYISSTVPFSGSGGNYPLLLRNSPGLDICQGVTVEGDLEIPPTAPGAQTANGAGADDTMVVAYNVSAGVTQAYMVGISLDSGPGNLFLQKNNGTNVTDPQVANDPALPVSIATNIWFTVKAAITKSGSDLLIQAKVWQEGTAEPATWPISYTDPTPFPCGETWQQGWQADASSGLDYFSNLQIIGPGPIIDPQLIDSVPAGMSYGGSNTTPLTGAPSLSWSFPGTFLAQSSPLSWWGQVSCPGPVSNLFTMSASGVSMVNSNTVSAAVTGSCITSTPTNSPTITSTPTVTPEISNCGSGSTTSQFLDTFPNSASLTNYTYYPIYSGTASTAAAQGYSVAGGELLDSAPNQSYVLLNSAQFPANLSAYTVEADFNMATRSSSTGLFGLTFLEQPNDAGYIFQWNGNPENTPPHWQIQKDAGSSGNGFTYLPPAGFGAGVAAPTYTPGNWVHLKVVVVGGTTFNCYVNLYDGNGDQLVYSLTDTLGAPYTSGEVGFREVMVSPNSLQMR